MTKNRKEKKMPEAAKLGTRRVTRSGNRDEHCQEAAVSTRQPYLAPKMSPIVWRNPELQCQEMESSLEESLLAFLDAHGVRDVEGVEEDKFTFLDATYIRCGIQANAYIPPEKMFQAIYRNIQRSRSVEFTRASFKLLHDLEKRHPRIAVAENLDNLSGQAILRLDVDERVWSPLHLTVQEMKDEMLQEWSAGELPVNLVTLVETIAMRSLSKDGKSHVKTVPDDMHSSYEGVDSITVLGQFQLLQNLVELAQNDFYSRMRVAEANLDSSVVQGSFFYELLCVCRHERRKTFFSNLFSILDHHRRQTKRDEETADDKHHFELSHPHTNAQDAQSCNKPALLPSASDFADLAQRILLMVVELDIICKRWSFGPNKSMGRDRLALDIFNYFSSANNIEAYLQGVDCPYAKMRFIVDYFVTYCRQKELIVKGLNDDISTKTIEKLLACFGEDKTTKFVHNFSQQVLPVLLAYAFQASLLIHSEVDAHDHEDTGRTNLVEVSRSLVDALTDVREFERQGEMPPVAEQVLKVANSILQA